jgi:predicted DNA binding CopG/RHH family protein
MNIKQLNGDNMEQMNLNVEIERDLVLQLKKKALDKGVTLKKYIELLIENEVLKNE